MEGPGNSGPSKKEPSGGNGRVAMYEITVIEKLCSGEMQMAHIPCQDEDVESAALDLITQENKCVAAGLLLNYTTITCYFPNRDAIKHYAPHAGLFVRYPEIRKA